MIWLALSACQHIFLELLNQRFRLWNAPSPPRRLFVVVCTCRRDTRSERARSWPDVVEMSGVRGGRATPLNSFNYKSKRTRCPRVGVSLECDVQSWHPSAPEESSRARRNLRQLFLHPRQPDKVLRQIFDSPPRHRAVALPAGPNDEADLCVMKQFLKNLSWNFEGTFAVNGKLGFISCSDETPRLNFSASGNVCVLVLLWANTLIFEKAVSLNNYVTHALKYHTKVLLW